MRFNVNKYRYYYCFIGLILLINKSLGQTYYVDESQSYTWTAGFPQSCHCEENGATDLSCKYFQCSCICDLTAAQCDYGCCCDPDCSSDQVDRFENLGVCKREGDESSTVKFCYSSTELNQINPRTPLTGESTSKRGVDEALCVFKQNAVFPTQYYKNTGLQSASIFSTSDGQKEYDYIEQSPLATLRSEFYDQNTTIVAYYDLSSNGNSLVSYGSGFWQIPQPDFTGICNDFNLVLFEVDIPSPSSGNGCLRIVPTAQSEFSQQCVGVWSLDYYVTKLKLAKNAATLFSTVTNVQNVSITLNSVSHRDFATGVTNTVSLDLWNVSSCGTTVSNSLTQSSFMSNCGYSVSSQLLSLFDSSASICRSAVREVVYTVLHDSTAMSPILSVLADVVITDVPLSVTEQNQFRQYISVSFISNMTSFSSRTEENGNLNARKRSGNPGYNIGFPVLFGQGLGTNGTVTNSNPVIISEEIKGLSIFSPFINFDANDPSSFGKSLCPSKSKLNYVDSISVNFGYDVTTGCVLSLNRSELIDLCCQGASCSSSTISPFSDPSTGVPYFFNTTPGYIGIYGNSDPLDVSQWFLLSISKSSSNREWVDKNNICYNMFTGLNYQFLIAKSGERSFPQNKIVAASATITSSDWSYRYPEAAAATKQSFPLTITVSFVYINAEDLEGYVPPAPPVLFKVPYDVFYPFQSSPASSNRVQSYVAIVLAISLVLTSLAFN